MNIYHYSKRLAAALSEKVIEAGDACQATPLQVKCGRSSGFRGGLDDVSKRQEVERRGERKVVRIAKWRYRLDCSSGISMM